MYCKIKIWLKSNSEMVIISKKEKLPDIAKGISGKMKYYATEEIKPDRFEQLKSQALRETKIPGVWQLHSNE